MAAKASSKDQAMAADLKKRGVERTTGACALCHSTVSLVTYPGHLSACQGRRPNYGKAKR